MASLGMAYSAADTSASHSTRTALCVRLRTYLVMRDLPKGRSPVCLCTKAYIIGSPGVSVA